MVRIRTIHYSWIIVFSGNLTIVAVFGLGRFPLGMLLPCMVSDLDLGYSHMGFIGTGNFIGYLLGVYTAAGWLNGSGTGQSSAVESFRWVLP